MPAKKGEREYGPGLKVTGRWIIVHKTGQHKHKEGVTAAEVANKAGWLMCDCACIIPVIHVLEEKKKDV